MGLAEQFSVQIPQKFSALRGSSDLGITRGGKGGRGGIKARISADASVTENEHAITAVIRVMKITNFHKL